MRVILVLLFSIQLPGYLIAQVLYSQKDVQIFNSILSAAEKNHLADSAIEKIVIHVGKQFLGSPYVGGILDQPESENLVIDLNGLDCVTYLESTLALSIIIKENKTQFEDFCDELKFIRYRNGILNGYASRLHYFYDWINNNQQKGILENKTETIGGRPFEKKINSMSKNRIKYPHLKEDSSLIVVKKIEEGLSSMNKFYIPKEEIQLTEDQIQDGDLVALAPSIDGLEVAHVGIAIHLNKRLHLMHASSLNKKVEISELSLSEMLKNNSTYTGIIISRLKEGI
jgi:hypothetical protein